MLQVHLLRCQQGTAITERIQRKVKSRTAKEGYAKRWASKVIWDGSIPA